MSRFWRHRAGLVTKPSNADNWSASVGGYVENVENWLTGCHAASIVLPTGQCVRSLSANTTER
jgi:hypothetical protein